MKEEPNIMQLFNKVNLIIQQVYISKNQYNTVYINCKLFVNIFEEEFHWDIACQKIRENFSITLDEQKSNKVILGSGYSDKQFDPTGIALSGNLGSGRAYFYKEKFNIKGDKTKLATSSKTIYSNGKYALSATIKEAVLANVLVKDFAIPTFETLAILETKEKFDFSDEYMDENDKIKTETYHLPCSLEVRVNKNKELYRLSNSLINNDKYTVEELEKFCDRLAKIEANKFCDRFLHGSWSVGNISTEGNLIDFDTATFVKGRYPQYSNTNKYKSNYFGYELLGQKLMIKSILENKIEKSAEIQNEIENFMDKRYEEYLKIRFCDLIGLDYNSYYEKYNEYIDKLCKKFCTLSRKFLPNYYAINVVESDEDSTYLFDFSNFFQKYLINKRTNRNNVSIGMKLLLNDVEFIDYEKVGMIKEKIEEFFEQDLAMDESSINELINSAMDFIEEYDELFSKIEKEENISNIKLKQYIINANRDYLYADRNIYGLLAYLYENKKIDLVTLNRIINAIIKTNQRNNYNNEVETKIGLKLYKDCLTYFVVSSNYYYLIIEPYSTFEIEFAKVIVNEEELRVSHSFNENGNIMVTEKVYYSNLEDILNFDIVLKINGREYEDILG